MSPPAGTTRHIEHPQFEIEEDDGDILVRFRIPGSKFGPVEVVLSFEEVEQLVESLEQAAIFAGATGGDSDG
jgi:hypothetical protein